MLDQNVNFCLLTLFQQQAMPIYLKQTFARYPFFSLLLVAQDRCFIL